MKPSERFELNSADMKKWGKNALIFSAPLVILFLTEIQKGTKIEDAAILLQAAVINAVIDLIRKYTAGK